MAICVNPELKDIFSNQDVQYLFVSDLDGKAKLVTDGLVPSKPGILYRVTPMFRIYDSSTNKPT